MIRLGLSIAILLLSFLAIFAAPSYHLWIAAIIVTEFPLIFMALAFSLLLSGYVTNKYKYAGTIVALIALVLFSTPVARAYLISDNVRVEMNAALDITDADTLNKRAFSLWHLAMRSPENAPSAILEYSDIPKKSLTMDFYKSDSTGFRPCIVIIHGGSWSSGDSRQLPELNTVLAEQGYHVASVDYRKVPEWKSPAPLEDIKNALSFIHKNAEELMIDTGRIVLLGRSAGAQIALLAAYTIPDKGIKGVIDFYGPADMVWGYSVPANPWVFDSQKVMENYLGGSLKQVPDKYKTSSPIEYVTEKSVPTLIIHGKNDVLVSYRHSVRLAKKLKEKRVPHYLLGLPWATHGFDYTINGPGGQLSTYAVSKFLHKVLGELPK